MWQHLPQKINCCFYTNKKNHQKKFHIQKTMSPFDDFSTRKRKKSTLDTTLKNRKKIHCVT
jgi:hypothetical protein